MEALIETVFTDPIFVIVGIVLVVLIALAIFKKLFKMVFILVAIFFLYVGYLVYTGDEPIKAFNEIIEDLKEIDTKKMKKKLEKTIEDVREKADDAIDKTNKKMK